MQLLIVDDSRIERMILKEMLQSEGYAVQEAENGEQALKMALQSCPDMIISDILMPVMDGFKLCREIRSDSRTCGIPFVFYTGTYTKAEDEDFALKMGADRFLVKKMGWPDFFRALQDVIREREMGGSDLPGLSPKDEKEIYKLYNERLIKKLEDKVHELESEVSWRKKLEKQLYESQESLQLALDGANLGMWDWNVQTGEAKFNQQWGEYFGYSPEEIPPNVNTWKRAVHPDDLNMTMEKLQANLEGMTKTYETEHRLKDKSGNWHWVLARGKVVSRNEKGEALRHVGTFLDITDRVAAKQALEHEKERYRLIFNSAPIGIYHYDTNAVVTECNPATYKIFGSSYENAVGLNQLESLKNEDLINAIKKSLSGRPGRFQGAYTSVLSGKTAMIKALFVPIFSDSKILTGGIGVVEDISARIKASEQLAKSEAKYRTILESLEDGYFEVDLSGNLIFFNSALCGILGYPASELKGKNYRSFMDAENAKKTFQTFNKVYQTGEALKGFDWNIIRSEGTGAYLDTSVSPIPDEDGKIIGFRGLTRDVSERRLIEKFLAESEERFRLIVESAPVGIFSYDKKGIIQACNQAYVDINGSSYGKLIGFNLLKQVTNPLALEAVRKSLAGSRGHYRGEYTSVTGGRKSYIKADFVPVFMENVQLAGGMCVVEDLTDKVIAEQALRDSEEKYRGLAERSPIIIILIKKGGRPYYVSPSVEKLLGFKPEEVLGKLPGDFMSKEDEARVFYRMNQIVKGLEADSFDVQMLKKDGTPVTIEWTLIPVKKGDALDSFQALGRDITEKKIAEDALKNSRRQLRALSKHLQNSREQERAGIAREIHDDLGQSLTAIKMDASWLKTRIPEDRADLHNKVEDTLILVDSAIRTVKRISSELRPGLLDDLGLSAAIEWQAKEYQRRSGINIHVTLEPEEIVMAAEVSIAIFRVCQETLTNVIRHAGATVAWVRLAKNSQHLKLEVADNGCGINDQAIAKKNSFGLIGMRERVHAIGGEIRILRIPEGGTRVNVTVPLGGETN